MGREVIVSIAFLLLCLLGLSLGDPELDLNAVTADEYAGFLTDLRNQLNSTLDSKWKIPVLQRASQVPDAQRFVQATLTSNGKGVTLGIDVTNLYLYAYRVPGKSYFFLDAPNFTKTYLFRDTQQVALTFDSNYQSLGGREKVNLGIDALRNAVNVLAKDSDTTQKKKALVVIIQMVCEAARFKYIEEKIRQSIDPDGIYDVIKPDATIIDLENNWASLSAAVQNADSNGRLKNPVKIGGQELQDVQTVLNYLAVMKNSNGNSVILWSCNNVNDQKGTLMPNHPFPFPRHPQPKVAAGVLMPACHP